MMQPKKTRNKHQLPPEGVLTAKWIPYGYMYDPDSAALVKIDPEVVEYVRYIFRKYLEGIPIPQICKQLDEKDAPNPTLRRLQLGDAVRENADKEHWNASSLNQFLFNPMYAGDLLLSGRVWDAVYYYSGEPAPEGIQLPEIEENHHEAIIRREDMKQVALAYLKDRSQRHSKKEAVARNETDKKAYSIGFTLRCGECGRIMNKNEIFMGPGNSFIAYTCSSFTLQQASKCTNRFYRLDEISAAVNSVVDTEKKLALKQLEIVSGEEKGPQYTRVEAYLQRQINNSVDTVRKNIINARRIKSRYEAKKLSSEEYQQELLRLDEADREAEKMVMAALIRIRDFRKACRPDNPWLSLYASLPDELDFINDTDLVHKIIKEIKVYPDRQPEVTLSHMEEKETFMSTLYMPLRLKAARDLSEDTSSKPEEDMEKCMGNERKEEEE